MACPIVAPVGISGAITAYLSPLPRSRTGSRPGGKKAEARLDTEHLDWALENFSGYIAIDELYDGPFCVLSLVDNHTYKRIRYQVLDHDPTHDDIRSFLKAFQRTLLQRNLTLEGITTDGSNLYPEPLAEIFPGVPHQLCEFHILKELVKEVLKAVAKVRKQMTAQKPKLGRGRPASKAAKRLAKKRKRLDAKISDLFEHRHLFVKKVLTASERKTLLRITRGQPLLRKLRELMEEVYRLFDRRCRLATALEKLRKLRQRVRRFRSLSQTLKKLFSLNLEKALTFLDDKLLPSTSNAVERSNRRHRKMQKSVYRVRTLANLSGRLALDLCRESQATPRQQTLTTLHRARAAENRPILML
jgi:hypothetical protein